MKIAYFVYNLDYYSGAALQAFELSKHVGYEIIFFNFRRSGYRKHYIDNKLVIDVPANRIYRLLVIFINILRYNVKILHFHGFFPLGMMLGWILRRKIILKTTLLGKDDFQSISRSRFPRISMFIAGKADLNVVLSEVLKNINSQFLGSQRVVKIYNGVSLPEKDEQKPENNTFCYIGLICKRKRPYESIKYFIDNYSSLKGSKLIMVGPYENVINNIEFDEAYVKKCFGLVTKHQMKDRVVFTGNISKTETFEIYRKSKALIFFSLREGMPNSVLEAMAHNCVPLLSELDGTSKEMVGEDAGYVLEDLSEKISLDSIDEKIVNKLPLKRAAEIFDIKKIAKSYESLYQELDN